MFRLRSNTLNLNDKNRHRNESTKCSLCEDTIENVEHFLLDCQALNSERIKILELQRPRIENKNELVSRIIFDEYSKYETQIQKMWLKRLNLLEQRS